MLVGFTILIAFCLLFTFPLSALFILLAGLVPGAYLIIEGMKKRKIEIDGGTVRFFKHGVLKGVVSRDELAQVTYEFYKSVEAGILEDLSFERRTGKPLKLRIERLFKERDPAFEEFIAFVETWCTEKGLLFSRKVGADVKGISGEELAEMYKRHKSPHTGTLNEWRKKLRALKASFSTLLILCLSAMFSPFLLGITSTTIRLFMLGFLILGPLVLYIMMYLIDVWLNKKPEPVSGYSTRTDELAREKSSGSGRKSRYRKAIGTSTLVGILATLMVPVWVVESRCTRILFSIGFIEIIGLVPFILLLCAIEKPDRKSKNVNEKMLRTWRLGEAWLAFLLGLYSVILAFFGGFFFPI